MKSFEKLVYLPSGGIDYSPFVWVKNLDGKFKYFQLDGEYNSYFELILATIRNYTCLSIDVCDLYLCDVYHLWTNFLISDIFPRESITTLDFCRKCGQENKIIIPLGDLDFFLNHRFSSSYKKPQLEKTISVDNKNYNIVFDMRRAKHNIEFSHLQLFSDSEEIEKLVSLFLVPQINKITSDKVILPEDYISFFINLKLKDLYKIYHDVVNFNFSIGLTNELVYSCKNSKCKSQNEIFIYDDLIYSKIYPKKINITKIENMIQNTLSISRLPVFTIKSFMDIPLKYTEFLDRVIPGMNFRSGAVIV